MSPSDAIFLSGNPLGKTLGIVVWKVVAKCLLSGIEQVLSIYENKRALVGWFGWHKNSKK